MITLGLLLVGCSGHRLSAVRTISYNTDAGGEEEAAWVLEIPRQLAVDLTSEDSVAACTRLLEADPGGVCAIALSECAMLIHRLVPFGAWPKGFVLHLIPGRCERWEGWSWTLNPPEGSAGQRIPVLPP